MDEIKINQEVHFGFINQIAKQFYDINENTLIQFIGKNFSKPSGIAYLSSLIYSKKDLLRLSYDNKANISYLQRADFFKNLEFDIEEEFDRHEVSFNMLECTKIQKDGDPYFVDERLKKILESHLGNKKHLILGILLTTYEIVDNILEHSSGGDFKTTDRISDFPGFVCAQYYSNNTIEIGISDNGIGIVNSMQSAYPELTRKEILQKAFQFNTTRHIKIMPTRGNGLAKLKEFVLQTDGQIICRTNEFTIFFNTQHRDGIITQETFDLEGTHFHIEIGCINQVDTKKIFNAEPEDYETDAFDDFFDF